MKNVFCTKCGTAMVIEYYFHHYDKHTGEKVFMIRDVCPHHRFMFDGHDSGWREDRGYRMFVYGEPNHGNS